MESRISANSSRLKRLLLGRGRLIHLNLGHSVALFFRRGVAGHPSGRRDGAEIGGAAPAHLRSRRAQAFTIRGLDRPSRAKTLRVSMTRRACVAMVS